MNKLNLSVPSEHFFDQFVHTLHRDNDSYNLPFITSSLYQILANPTCESVDFISDITKYRVDIDVEDTNDDYEVAIVKIYLYDKQGKIEKDHYYKMHFILENRYDNYCQCTPDMEGYREDKQCCGYDCDATFCTCYIDRIDPICFHNWNGCEHDYWDYEDKFYEAYPELKDAKKKQTLIDNINRTKKEIDFAQEQLEDYQRQLRNLEPGVQEEYDGFDETLECGAYNC